MIRTDYRNDPGNVPSDYATLSSAQKVAIQAWLRAHIKDRRTPNPYSSYALKHIFESAADGFYMTNGQFKGAMHAAGYAPITPGVLNEEYRISVAHSAVARRYGPHVQKGTHKDEVAQ